MIFTRMDCKKAQHIMQERFRLMETVKEKTDYEKLMLNLMNNKDEEYKRMILSFLGQKSMIEKKR